MKIPFITIILLFFFLNGYSQKKDLNVSGVVKSENNERLFGANIYIKSLNLGCSSSNNGEFSIQIPKGKFKIYCSFLGYKTDSIEAFFSNDTTIYFNLKSVSIINSEVVVSAKKADDNLTEKTIGILKIDSKEIEKLPSLMGENDPIRHMQLSTGVQSVGEGFASFFVRGGSADQNLILLNNATIYNPSHILGFYSVFNNDVIETVTLYKGLMPSKYGGRTSSVLDVDVKDGNMDKFGANISVGILSSKLSMNGPIIKNKLSYRFAVRKTYINEVLNPVIRKFDKKANSFFNDIYGFYDLNGIVSWRINSKNFFKLNLYSGNDNFSINKIENSLVKMNWGNIAFSSIWNHIFDDKTNSQLSVCKSIYNFDMAGDLNKYFLNVKSAVNEAKLNYTLNKKFENNSFYTGFELKYNKLLPGDKTLGYNDLEFEFNDNNYLNTANLSVFLGDNFKLFSIIDIDAGLRFNYYAFLGSYTYYIAEKHVLLDSIQFSNGEIIKDDFSISPRFSLNYRISESTSLKAGFSFNEQNIHVAELSALALPADLWIPSTLNLNPQKGIIVSSGIFKNFKSNKIKTNVEIYYKQIKNIIEYNTGLINNFYLYNIDDEVISGKGKSWGIESGFEFNSKKLTANFSYTYSRSKRYFDDIFGGKPFYAKNDRPHDLTTSINYNISKKISFSTIFVFASGKLMTMPDSRYMIQGMIINSYIEKNTYRMRDYNRLDISIVYNNHKHETWESIWELSVYNVYNRMNPLFIYYEITGNIYDSTQKVIAKQVSMFPILPALTWKLKFGK